MRSISSVRPPSRRALWLALGLVAGTLSPGLVASAAAEMHPHVRQGWLVGLGVGGGTAGVDGAGYSSNREGGLAGSMRMGYAFSSRLSLELDGTLWTREEGGTRFSLTSTTATLNYFPGETGLVLRGGVGGGSGEARRRESGVTLTASEDGLGLLGGIGYEVRVTPRFALGPQVEIGWIDLDSFNADWVNFELTAAWYFIKR